MSAMKRAWRPVGQILVWKMQHGSGEGAATAVRGLTTITTTVTTKGAAHTAGPAMRSWLYGAVVESNFIRGQSSTPPSWGAAAAPWRPWNGSSAPQVRFASSSSSSGALAKDEEPEETTKADSPPTDVAQHSNYWGVTTKSFHRDDGSKWPWNCFRPQDTYSPNYNIDITKHREPTRFNEKLALWTVKAIKIPVNMFYSTRYGCRAMMLETVAAVPGMVGGMLLHLRSLRRFQHSGGWIKALLDEAENERMHLMTLMDLVQPVWYERALVVTVQGIFFNFYFLLYLILPRLAHRVTGYLEEEAIISYTTYLNEIDAGVVENVPAPEIAIDYWRLPSDARLRDMILALRADEAHHRDVNHYAADVRQEGKELHESPAPVDYH